MVGLPLSSDIDIKKLDLVTVTSLIFYRVMMLEVITSLEFYRVIMLEVKSFVSF
jgi:hypothetical protein